MTADFETVERMAAQLALAAEEIIRLRGREIQAAAGLRAIAADLKAGMDHRWWHRFAWWRK